MLMSLPQAVNSAACIGFSLVTVPLCGAWNPDCPTHLSDYERRQPQDGGPVEGVWICMLQLPGGGDQGGDRDERADPHVQAALRGAGAEEGGPQGPPGRSVHAAYGRHEDAGNL